MAEMNESKTFSSREEIRDEYMPDTQLKWEHECEVCGEEVNLKHHNKCSNCGYDLRKPKEKMLMKEVKKISSEAFDSIDDMFEEDE